MKRVLSLMSALTWSASAVATEPTTDQCSASSQESQGLLRDGKLVAARDKLRVCVAESCSPAIREDCNTRLAEVESAIPTVALDVKGADGRELSNVKVTVDGTLLVEHLTGTPLAVDPGPHTFSFDAGSGGASSKQAFIVEGRKAQVVTAVLPAAGPTRSEAAKESPSPAPELTTPSAPIAAPPPPIESKASRRELRWPTYLGLGIGAAGVAMAAIGGGVALNARSQCPGNVCPNQGVIDTARAAASVADAGAIVAVVGAIGGVALYLWAPARESPIAVSIGPGGAGVEIKVP
jgi:hypothetical protein